MYVLRTRWKKFVTSNIFDYSGTLVFNDQAVWCRENSLRLTRFPIFQMLWPNLDKSTQLQMVINGIVVMELLMCWEVTHVHTVLFADIEVSFSLNLFPTGFSVGNGSEVRYRTAEIFKIYIFIYMCVCFFLIYSFYWLLVIGFFLDELAVIQ